MKETLEKWVADGYEAGYVQEESGASYRARKKGKCWNKQANKQTEINLQWWGGMSEKPTERVCQAGIFLKIKWINKKVLNYNLTSKHPWVSFWSK